MSIPTRVTAHDQLIRLSAFGILICLLIVTMILGQTLLIPFTWAFLFAFVLYPFCRYLERKRFPRTAASLIATILFCLLGGMVLGYLIFQAARIIQDENTLYEKLRGGLNQFVQYMESEWGIVLFDPASTEKQTANLGVVIGWFARQVDLLSKNLVTLTLIPMYLFFILQYRRLLTRFIERKYKGEQRDNIKQIIHQTQESIRSYLWGTLILTGINAVMSFAILFLLGIPSAFFFAIFIAVLNLIPYIGNLIAVVLVLLFVFVTTGSFSQVVFIAVALYISNLLQENFLRPALIGDKMEMNAMTVFTGVILGGMIWGFSGMVLFIPLLGILQAVLNSREAWRPYGIFFGLDKEEEVR